MSRYGDNMKFRCGFVSNSSSSSFIAVYAKVEFKKAEDVLKKLNLESMTKDEFIAKWKYEFDDGFENDWAGVQLDVPSIDELNDKSRYVYFESCDEHNDSDFWDGGEYDYDIGLDDFSSRTKQIFKQVSNENGFTDISKGFGAGRNG